MHAHPTDPRESPGRSRRFGYGTNRGESAITADELIEEIVSDAAASAGWVGESETSAAEPDAMVPLPAPGSRRRAVRTKGDTRTTAKGIAGLSYRTVAGLLLVALVIVFAALNRDETEISFIVFSSKTALWVALTIAAATGFLAGFLIGRRRYRR